VTDEDIKKRASELYNTAKALVLKQTKYKDQSRGKSSSKYPAYQIRV
jgi:hypothetical protein